MGSLASALAAPPPNRASKRLLVDVVLDGLDKVDREALVSALLNAGFGHKYLSDLLKDNGFEVSEKAVAAWRSARRRADG
jgi:hypothetical protein